MASEIDLPANGQKSDSKGGFPSRSKVLIRFIKKQSLNDSTKLLTNFEGLMLKKISRVLTESCSIHESL